MIVIGLTGNIDAGKSTVADFLVENHGFTKLSFGDPIKRMVRALNPIVGYDIYECDCGDPAEREIEEVTVSTLYDHFKYDDETVKESPWGEELRRLWQRFGTEAVRGEDEDFWVNQALKAMLESNSDQIVFDDVRFPNEAKMILDLNGPWFDGSELSFSWATSSLWQIARPEDNPFEGETADHESESYAGMLDEEIMILNEAGLDDLAETTGVALGFVLEAAQNAVDDGVPEYTQPALWEDDAELEVASNGN